MLRVALIANRPRKGVRRGAQPSPSRTELKQKVRDLEAELAVRKATEEALLNSELRYRTLFDSAPVGIAISDANGKVLAFNRRLCSMAGVTVEESLATPADKFYANPAQRLRLMAELRKKGRIVNREMSLKRKDGSVLRCELQMELVRSGKAKVILTSVQDVTRERRAERHLEGVAALLQSFATKPERKDYLNDIVHLLAGWCDCHCAGVRLLNEDGRLVYAAHTGFSKVFIADEQKVCFNRSNGCVCVRVLTGRPRGKDNAISSQKGSVYCNDTGRSLELLGPAPDGCQNISCVESGYQSVAHVPLRYRGLLLGTLHLADGRSGRFPEETIEFLESIAPLVAEAIHRFKVEGSLRESEARFRSMFERHDAVMLLLDPDTGRIVDANLAAARFYGYSRPRLRCLTIAHLTQPQGESRALQPDCLLEFRKGFFTASHRLAKGVRRTVEIYSSTIQVNGRDLWFAVIHDITERKLLERQVIDTSEKERQRVGRDLHDSLGGKLAGGALVGQALANKLRARSFAEASLADEVVTCLNECIRDSRAIARGLCPVELSVSGLVGGLAELAVETQRQTGVSCCFVTDHEITSTDPFVSLHLFRIVQEAVTNALRHARPRNIIISLNRQGSDMALEIKDDGGGLSSVASPLEGMGLRTMQHRSDAIGGRLAFKPNPGGGTVVSCLLSGDKSGRLFSNP